MIKKLLCAVLLCVVSFAASAQQNPAPHLKTQTYGDVSDFAATDAFVAAAIASLQPLSYSLVTPSVRTCPAANCPNPANAHQAPQILASTWVESIASSTVPRQQEWGSVFGMYSNVGQSTNYPTIPPSQKVTVYAGMVQGPLSGPTWTLNTDIVRNGCPTTGAGTVQPYIGSAQPCGTPMKNGIGVSTIGYELDFSNWDQNIDIGGAEAVGMAIVTNSEFRGLAAWYAANGIDGTGTTASWSYGMLMTNKTAYDADYGEVDNVAINGYLCGGNHSGNCFVATGSPSGDSFKDNGNPTNASFESGAATVSNPNYGFVASGSYNVAAFDAVGAATTSVVTGAHLKAFRAPPFGDICLNGNNNCLFYSNTSSLVNLTSSTGVQNFQFWDNGDFHVQSGVSYLSGGAKVVGGLTADKVNCTGVVQQTPASGATIALSSKCLNWINPATSNAALTLTLPTGNADGDVVKVTFTKAVTVSLSFPGAINGNITSAAANTTVEFTYIGAPAALWQRTNNPS